MKSTIKLGLFLFTTVVLVLLFESNTTSHHFLF